MSALSGETAPAVSGIQGSAGVKLDTRGKNFLNLRLNLSNSDPLIGFAYDNRFQKQ
jgi:hypothetical protein